MFETPKGVETQYYTSTLIETPVFGIFERMYSLGDPRQSVWAKATPTQVNQGSVKHSSPPPHTTNTIINVTVFKELSKIAGHSFVFIKSGFDIVIIF